MPWRGRSSTAARSTVSSSRVVNLAGSPGRFCFVEELTRGWSRTRRPEAALIGRLQRGLTPVRAVRVDLLVRAGSQRKRRAAIPRAQGFQAEGLRSRPQRRREGYASSGAHASSPASVTKLTTGHDGRSVYGGSKPSAGRSEWSRHSTPAAEGRGTRRACPMRGAAEPPHH